MTLEKFGYMLETPPYLTLLDSSSDNAMSDADNQQGSRSDNESGLTPQRLHAELLNATESVSRAYLFGAYHDATFSPLHRTVRYGQADVRWLQGLALLLAKLGHRSWMYREGKTRQLWVLETSAIWLRESPLLATTEDATAYARGYFDAEGGIPRQACSRLYIQLVQKDFGDLARLRSILRSLGIDCGSIHNPSIAVDPDFWRFYVLASSHDAFARRVGSWHPRKRQLLEAWLDRSVRMKI